MKLFLFIILSIAVFLFLFRYKIFNWFFNDINVPVQDDDDWSEANRLLDINKERFS